MPIHIVGPEADLGEEVKMITQPDDDSEDVFAGSDHPFLILAFIILIV